ncbi:GntR family transcriptional regulator, partial [Kitasatospora sp. NPDC059747]|uniref:GntR family transcriptional regulator n=1 Tax=Kitasatospora sp. NPDC059747 TaxID=3346930 RepID=UPI003649945F
MSDTPSYLQVADALRGQLTSRRLQPGDRMPSISALQREHNVSTGVIQRAYALLIDEGLVLARPGAGYYVKSQEPPAVLVRRQRVAPGDGSPTEAALARQGVVGTWRGRRAPPRAPRPRAPRAGGEPPGAAGCGNRARA